MKKILALCLAMLMVMCMSVSAFADDPEEAPADEGIDIVMVAEEKEEEKADPAEKPAAETPAADEAAEAADPTEEPSDVEPVAEPGSVVSANNGGNGRTVFLIVGLVLIVLCGVVIFLGDRRIKKADKK